MNLTQRHSFLILMFVIGCGSYPAGDLANQALESDELATVTISDDWIHFEPATPISDFGVIFYPGGKVEAEAYAPILKEISRRGLDTYLLYVPRDLAILNTDAALNVMDTRTETEAWVLAGHSLGGVAAAKMTSEDTRVVGLSLWASYPSGSVDLSDSTIAVQSLVGTEDAVVNWENWETSSEQLPESTDWIQIEGGNHSQFGDYGLQEGDGTATISPEAQWEYTANALQEMITSQIP